MFGWADSDVHTDRKRKDFLPEHVLSPSTENVQSHHIGEDIMANWKHSKYQFYIKQDCWQYYGNM